MVNSSGAVVVKLNARCCSMINSSGACVKFLRWKEVYQKSRFDVLQNLECFFK
jgi:hypothetical protein